MKKLFFIAACLLLTQLSAFADNDKVISYNQLPANTRQFIEQHFSQVKVDYVKMDNDWDDKEYKVYFIDKSKIEFDQNGEWEKIKCKYTSIPTSALPKQIADFVNSRHPGNTVVEIERDNRKYEVKLNNGLEIKFDLKFNFRGYDD